MEPTNRAEPGTDILFTPAPSSFCFDMPQQLEHDVITHNKQTKMWAIPIHQVVAMEQACGPELVGLKLNIPIQRNLDPGPNSCETRGMRTQVEVSNLHRLPCGPEFPLPMPASMPRFDRGDLWKNKARSLQLQLRNRFRVAVDRHWRRQPTFIPEGYFSSTLQRWLRRFRDFRQESLPSSSFYRKKVSKDFSSEESALLGMLQAVAVPVLGNVCHVFMNGLNRVQVYGLEKLHEPLLHRSKGKPLLTVSNHVASMDDPLVIASLLPPHVLLDAQNLRWTLCATDRCFKNPVTSAFFRSVKVLPVSCGDGIYQKGMDMAISKLNHGGWVHIFPEGSRSRDGGKTMSSSKRGVGRLVLDSDSVPIVVPFVHIGMQDIMPIGASFPRVGKTVTVLVGDPINFDDLLHAEKGEDVPRRTLYDAVATRIGNRLHELKVQVTNLAIEQEMLLKTGSTHSMERASGILHQVDWELFGMGSSMSVHEDSEQRQETLALPNENVTKYIVSVRK